MNAFYQLALRNAFTRKLARTLRGRLKKFAGCPDPYVDLFSLNEMFEPTLLLDIGCFDGSTIERFIEGGFKCTVFGFDPFEENIARASSRLKKHPNVSLIKAAVSDSSETREFFVNSDPQTSSLLDNAKGNNELISHLTEHKEKISVQTIQLDTWLSERIKEPQKVIIKCDVQGAEMSVVRGAKNTLKDVIAFYSEIQLRSMYKGQTSFEELNNTLESEHNLVLYSLYPCLRSTTGYALQADALWIDAKYIEKFHTRNN